MVVIILLTSTYFVNLVHTAKGEFSKIKDFPHSVFLTIECHTKNEYDFFTCCASILNQAILISAAHCLDGCLQTSEIFAYTGHEKKKKGLKTQVNNFIAHENFDSQELENDIALLRLRNELRFGDKLKRVAVMRKPPYEEAVIAGWGRVDENGNVSDWLTHKAQTILSYEACAKVLGEYKVPLGAFCAKEQPETSYLGKGGSGSALIVRNFIQIGILSFYVPKRSKNIAVYTDIGYFYNWINKISKKLYCSEKYGRSRLINRRN